MNADDFLRRLRNDDRWTDDAPPRELLGASRDAAPRARRALAPIFATAFTVLLVAVVGGLALLGGRVLHAGETLTTPAASTSNASGVIPWSDATPAPTSGTAAASGGINWDVATGRVPLCALAQLRVTSGQGGTAMGTWREGVMMTNRSSAACLLTASVLTLQALSDGRFVTFGKTVMEDASGSFRLEPGKTAHFWGSLSPCYNTRDFKTEVLVPTYLLLGGERVRLASTVPNDFGPLCAHPDKSQGVSIFGQEGDVPETVSPYADLQASMDMQEDVHAGETVDYTVTLSNPTSKAIALTPCPTYDQDYVDPGNGTKQLLVVTHYVLNCTPIPTLEPGQSATFAMRTVIPVAARGLAKISWSIDGNASVTAIRTIRGE